MEREKNNDKSVPSIWRREKRTFEISEADKKELLRYLFKRPYMEVAALIGMIAALKPTRYKEKNGKDKPN